MTHIWRFLVTARPHVPRGDHACALTLGWAGR